MWRSPYKILTEKTSLIALTDGSDDAVANSLFVVKIPVLPDAREVTIDHLKDPKVSTLIAVSSKMLDDGQTKWGTYEVELLGMCRTVTKHGKYITTATARFPTEGKAFKAKIGFISDSTTAIGRWKSLTLPIGVVDYLSAKARRFYSWADDVAGTKYWPFPIQHMSGDDMSLPHMLTHLGNLAKQRAAEMKTVGIECIMLPMNVHSYHNGYSRDAADLDYTINSLQLNTKDVIEMHRAYLSDDTEYLSVPIKLNV